MHKYFIQTINSNWNILKIRKIVFRIVLRVYKSITSQSRLKLMILKRKRIWLIKVELTSIIDRRIHCIWRKKSCQEKDFLLKRAVVNKRKSILINIKEYSMNLKKNKRPKGRIRKIAWKNQIIKIRILRKACFKAKNYILKIYWNNNT